ncbi:MAG: hypothetical protein U5Q44_06640 [Dehalococcoidia bacterium]|nr:hypothetical protein [Dehalococcoidia bacterium]
MELHVELEGDGTLEALPGDGADLVAFMSFAVVRGFGAQHPLIALADRLHDEHHVRLGPLTTFYERATEDVEDEEKLEMAWQEPGELAAALEGVAEALAADEQCGALVRRANAEGLQEQVNALRSELQDAREEGRRVRLSYTL